MNQVEQLPVRAGVFESLSAADHAVTTLLASGFNRDQISVICSDDRKVRLLSDFQQDAAGTHTPRNVAIGGSIGAALGGFASIVGTVASGGAATIGGGAAIMLVAGNAGLFTGGVVGGLLGAFMTRGMEKEIADYYEQAVYDGAILVAVEEHETDDKLLRAERLLVEAGAKPLALPEG